MDEQQPEASDELEPNVGEGEIIDIWPECPRCGRPRHTRCPICGTAGSYFPRADQNFGAEPSIDGPNGDERREDEPTSAPARLALICTMCDEPWLADFLRRCEWCSYDFGHGIEFKVPRKEVVTPVEIDRRSTILLILLAAIVVALFAWFLYIGR